MPKFYNKLIRDKIPEIIAATGATPNISVLNDADFKKALKAKMVEEAQELGEAKSVANVLNELCDLEELVQTIAKSYGFTTEDVEKHRKEKLRERGGFEKQLFLESVNGAKKNKS